MLFLLLGQECFTSCAPSDHLTDAPPRRKPATPASAPAGLIDNFITWCYNINSMEVQIERNFEKPKTYESLYGGR